MLDSDVSSEYEIDLEEDFLGKIIYEIICILLFFFLFFS